MGSTYEVNPFEKNLSWPFVLFTAHSFPACLLMIYLTHSSVTFLCRDQPYVEKLRISDNWETLTEYIKLPCPSQLPASQATGALVIPREPAWNEAAVREQVGTAHTSQQWLDLPCELPGNGISARELLLFLPSRHGRLRRASWTIRGPGRASQQPRSLLFLSPFSSFSLKPM